MARAAELAALTPEARVLEVGTGSGYQAAVLARLARWVFSLERIPELAAGAVRLLKALGFSSRPRPRTCPSRSSRSSPSEGAS